MNAAERRTEIVNALVIGRFVTARQLAKEFGVTVRTIQNDIQFLSCGYPVYTKQGSGGGIFMDDDYKPYINTLSKEELDLLVSLRDAAITPQREILAGIILKYGPSGIRR